MDQPGIKGPRIRTDIVDLYVFHRADVEHAFLQMRRVGGWADGAWHPIMGRVEVGETAPAAALRELEEEAGLRADDGRVLGFWAIPSIHPAYMPSRNGHPESVLLSPRFALEVAEDWEPIMNHEHDAARWVREGEIEAKFMWPSQRGAIRDVVEYLRHGALAESGMRIALPLE